MFDITRSASSDPDDLDTPGDPAPPDRFATLDDLNMMASAIMDHVIEHDRRQEARIDDLERLASGPNGKPPSSEAAPAPPQPRRAVVGGQRAV